eukprot:s917_g11.t1
MLRIAELPDDVNYWLLALVIEGIPCIIAYCRYGFEGVVATLATSLLTGAAAFGAGLLGGLIVSRVEGPRFEKERSIDRT